MVILKADKGNAIVLLQSGMFKAILRDPTRKIECEIAKLIKVHNWPEAIQTAVKLHASILLRLYGLPKVHKEGCPLQMIMNKIASPIYQVTKYLASL